MRKNGMKREIKEKSKCTTLETPSGVLSDEAIVRAVIAGDAECYGELVDRYEAKLLRYARVLLHDGDDAKDAVQEAFVSAYRNLERFDPERRFSSWIYRIVHNVARNIALKRKFLFFLSPEEWIKKGETIADGEASLEAQLEESELKADVRRYIKELPGAYRDPLILFYLEEKAYDEIAEILNMPLGTVGTRISRAKKMIRERLHGSSKSWKTLI